MPACCGHSHLRDEWFKIIKEEQREYKPEPPEIVCRLIPVIYHQIHKFLIAEKFPEIDTWAIPVHKAINPNGKFRAADLKDFLGLSSDNKLILITAAKDNFMEMLWEKGESLDYIGHKIDYWFPSNFSIWQNDSKFHQLFNTIRMQIHARRVKSQFVWFQRSENTPIELFEPIRRASAVILYGQFITSSRDRALFEHEVKFADRWFPRYTKFFLVAEGGLKNFPPDREIYRINARWINLGIRGRDMKNKPIPKTQMSIEEVLIGNLCEVHYGSPK